MLSKQHYCKSIWSVPLWGSGLRQMTAAIYGPLCSTCFFSHLQVWGDHRAERISPKEKQSLVNQDIFVVPADGLVTGAQSSLKPVLFFSASSSSLRSSERESFFNSNKWCGTSGENHLALCRCSWVLLPFPGGQGRERESLQTPHVLGTNWDEVILGFSPFLCGFHKMKDNLVCYAGINSKYEMKETSHADTGFSAAFQNQNSFMSYPSMQQSQICVWALRNAFLSFFGGGTSFSI